MTMQRDVSHSMGSNEVLSHRTNLVLVVCHAFTTSQSSEAHLELFKSIFAIAKNNTGLSAKF